MIPRWPRWAPPWWVLALVAAFSLSEPLAHLWLMYAMPAGLAHTGFRIGDTPFFLTAMRLYETGFESPYVVAKSLSTEETRALFSLPHHHLYAWIGVIARTLRLDPFLALGLANAAGAALYLLAVYAFLRVAAPRLAHRAFALFLLPPGLGWLVYLLAASDTSGNLNELGLLFARYELIEGPFLAPMLHLPRLYYTLALACGFAGLAALVATGKRGGGDVVTLLLTVLLLTAATWVNARVGVLILFVAGVWLLAAAPGALASRSLRLTALAAPVLSSAALILTRFSADNVYGAQNVILLLQRTAWFGSLFPALLLSLPLLVFGGHRLVRSLQRPGYALVVFCVALFAFFGVGYLGYKVYHGTLGTTAGEGTAAGDITDYAIFGALLLGVAALRPTRQPSGEHHPAAWFVLWLVPLLAASVIAPGGRFVPFADLLPEFGDVLRELLTTYARFTPERVLVVCGVPLAVLSAQALVWLGDARPRLARGLFAAMLTLGLASALTGWLFWQGPLGARHPDYRVYHSEAMHPNNAKLIARIPSGFTVLAPATHVPLFGDVIVNEVRGAKTLLGQPTLEFGDTDMLERISLVRTMYGSVGAYRALPQQLSTFGVHYIFIPQALWPGEYMLEQLAAQTYGQLDWLTEVDREGDARLFRVPLGELPAGDRWHPVPVLPLSPIPGRGN